MRLPPQDGKPAATVIASRNGSRSTVAKAASSRENGLKGGRPRKALAAGRRPPADLSDPYRPSTSCPPASLESIQTAKAPSPEWLEVYRHWIVRRAMLAQ